MTQSDTDSESLPLIDIDGRDIHEEARELRRSPVSRVRLPGGGTAFAITGHPEVEQILRLDNREVSANARLHWDDFRQGLIQPGHPAYAWVATENMFSAYGQAHRRLRKLNGAAFSPARIDGLRGAISQLVEELLEDVAAAGDVVNLRECFTGPLPLRVLCRLFGVPDEPDVRAAYEEAVAALFTTARSEAIPAAQARLAGLLAELVQVKRSCPGEDLTTTLLQEALPDEETAGSGDEEAPEQLTTEEVMATLFMYWGAGFETTTSLLNSSVVLLLSHPRYLEELRSGRLTMEEVGREVMRLRPPLATRIMRAAVEDVTVTVDPGDGGKPRRVTIPKGSAIMISYAGAGRDPRVYGEDAETFNPHRGGDVRMLSFGRGPHHCIGARLATLQAHIAVPALIGRFPGMRLAVPVDELPTVASFVQDDVRRLPVVLSG